MKLLLNPWLLIIVGISIVSFASSYLRTKRVRNKLWLKALSERAGEFGDRGFGGLDHNKEMSVVQGKVLKYYLEFSKTEEGKKYFRLQKIFEVTGGVSLAAAVIYLLILIFIK